MFVSLDIKQLCQIFRFCGGFLENDLRLDIIKNLLKKSQKSNAYRVCKVSGAMCQNRVSRKTF